MATTITQKINVRIGHRVLFKNGEYPVLEPHFHNWVFEFTMCRRDNKLDGQFRVADFRFITDKLNAWLDEHWEDATILEIGDPEAKPLRAVGKKVIEWPFAPTTESFATLAYKAGNQIMNDHGIVVLHVAVHQNAMSRVGYSE